MNALPLVASTNVLIAKFPEPSSFNLRPPFQLKLYVDIFRSDVGVAPDAGVTHDNSPPAPAERTWPDEPVAFELSRIDVG